MVNNNGVWYLVAYEDNNLKTYTFSKLKSIKALDDIFLPNKEYVSFIDKNEVNWFSKDEIFVELEIDNAIADYFLEKTLLALIKKL